MFPLSGRVHGESLETFISLYTGWLSWQLYGQLTEILLLKNSSDKSLANVIQIWV